MELKSIIKKIIGLRNIAKFKWARKIFNSDRSNNSKLKTLIKCKVYNSYNKLFSKVQLNGEFFNFFYSIDKYKTYLYSGDVIANLMLDYTKILDYSLEDYKDELGEDNFSQNEFKCIIAMENLIDRQVSIIKNQEIIDSLNGIKNRKATTFKDALQRILFINQLMWQTGHYLNGLGRLDLILDRYYYDDLENNIINKESAKELLREFLDILHKNYYFKSNSLSGDTGQIIILGGIDENKNYFSNDLTYMFIELMKEMQLPDPKVLLRVSKNVPRDLMELSVSCIATGIGCPLFANDDVIIPKLVDFGYDKSDVYNYGTAACWEPFITGKSFDQNNLKSISFMEPLRNLFENDLNNVNSINDFLYLYKKLFDNYFDDFISEVNGRKFGNDPLLSLFTDECISRKKDISIGGAKYNHYGFTGVGLANLINSIQIMDKYVFKDKKYTLKEFNEIIKNNFIGYESLLKEIKKYSNFYGKDSDEIINLSNEIIRFVSSKFDGLINPLGGKYKFGLSAPSYIDMSKDFPASFDGRKNGEPFSVHISSDDVDAYTELFNFASKLDYSDNRFNGNVIDFMVTPNFINDNFDKFVDFLILSIKNGFFEMQMNVVSSKILIEARKNPEKFPNLIVRVWGFSSYFKDLPDEYKDYLIERALKSEGNSN